MEKGILDIADEFRRFIGGELELWRYLIERCAPGYLELEEAGQGMAYGYDHSRFRAQRELDGLPLLLEMFDIVCKPYRGVLKSVREAMLTEQATQR